MGRSISLVQGLIHLFIFTILLSAFTGCSTSRHAGGYATIKGLQLQGPMREATIVVIKKYGDKTRQDTTSKESYTFDRAGNVLTHQKRKTDLSDSSSTGISYTNDSKTYDFDRRGRLVRVTQTFDGTTDLSEIRHRRNKFRVIHTYNNKTSRTYSKTDRQGKAIAINSFREDGTLASRTNDYYLPGCHKSRTLNFDKKGVVVRRRLELRDTIDGNARYYVSDSGTKIDQSMTVSTLNAQSKITSTWNWTKACKW